MGDTRFRVWFGNSAASVEQLARFEEIEVTQEMDALWEAHLRMSLCLDASGTWLDWPGDRAAPFSRVRVEIDVGTGTFTPLIDGPLVSIDGGLDSQPGRSTATMVVRDDSAFLNRDEENENLPDNQTDSDVAEMLFRRFAQIRDTRIDRTTTIRPARRRRGTVLQYLKDMARANDRRAYVLPGDQPGASIGCFLRDPREPASLPKLVMIGNDRNLASVSIRQNPHGAPRIRARILRTDDQGRATFETSAADLGLMRDVPAVPADLTPRHLVHPADNIRPDPADTVSGHARRAGYVYHLSGQTVPQRYGAVLSPYNKVRVDAGATPYSGDYLITKVVHRITPSVYSQHLEAKADSQSAVSGAQIAEALGGGLSLSITAKVGIL
jgi:hypothetical protein